MLATSARSAYGTLATGSRGDSGAPSMRSSSQRALPSNAAALNGVVSPSDRNTAPALAITESWASVHSAVPPVAAL